MGKKYVLHAPTDGGKPPCAFFQSSDGCRNGDSCKFAHVLANSGEVQIDAGSVVSSESEEEIKIKSEPNTPSQPSEDVFAEPSSSNKKKKNRRSLNADPFANPKKLKTEHNPSPENNPPKTEKAPKPLKKTEKNPKPVKKEQKSPKTTKETSTPSFLALNLPVASFTVGEKPKEKPKAASPPPDPKQVLPRHPQAQKWIPAIKASRDHVRFATSFNEESWKQQMPSPDWIQAKPHGDWCKDNPPVIAIDCEMCETQNPANGKVRNHKALCRISVVNALDGQVLLDSLVKPKWPVIDYRSRINGISQEHLEAVEFTLEHAQAFMKALCSQETVILGQAVHNDLISLQMIHYTVADSALLFEAADDPGKSVSLKDLTKAVLQKQMPNTHDSVNDAQCSREVIDYWLERKGKVEPVVRTSTLAKQEFSTQLFCHRIPKHVQKIHLQSMFVSRTFVQPKSINDIEYNGDNGKALVHFASKAHAELAFENIEGSAEPDAGGRLQKRVFLKSGGYIRVRKMIFNK